MMRRGDLPAATNTTSGAVVDAAIHVHSRLGPGLLEQAYLKCLEHVLLKRGHTVRRQQPVPIRFDDLLVEGAFVPDLVVDDRVIVELKAVERLDPRHFAQLNTYLRLTGLRVGLLMNFNEVQLRHGLRRIVRS